MIYFTKKLTDNRTLHFERDSEFADSLKNIFLSPLEIRVLVSSTKRSTQEHREPYTTRYTLWGTFNFPHEACNQKLQAFLLVVQKYVNMLHFTSTNQHVQPLNHSGLCKFVFAPAVMIVVTFANAQAATPSWWCGLIRTTCTPHVVSSKSWVHSPAFLDTYQHDRSLKASCWFQDDLKNIS